MKKNLPNACLPFVLWALTGCMAPIGATKTSPRAAYQHLHENALNSNRYSADARRVLNRYDLEEAFEESPDATLEKLQGTAVTDVRRDLLYALSELHYRNADRQRRSVKRGDPARARDSYLTSAIYAYLYLFEEDEESYPSPFDSRFQVASDLYSRGLAQGLAVGTNGCVDLSGGPRQTPPGPVEIQFAAPGFPFNLEQLHAFYAADDFRVRGLSTRNRDSGLGAPLIAVANRVGRFEEERRAPVTVFLRVTGTVRDWSDGKLSATLELYSAFDAAEVQVNGRSVPLQTDTTAPIAQGLNNSALWKLGARQFFSSEGKFKTGLRLMQPYAPGRIPVVLIHGTASSPVWWAEMLNTLRADPVLRERCQFWVFNYASGIPITMSAGILRDDLTNQIGTLDPNGSDAALKQMVIVGHSQGGLLAKLTATDTGDEIWNLVSEAQLDALEVDPQTRDLLRSNFFFEPLPCVARVIFVATPHRGSYRDTVVVQRLLNRFMTFPRGLVDASARLLKLKDTLRLPAQIRRGIPSSLNSMATDNPFMLKLADIPVAPGIKAHSIIAIKGKDEPPEGGDGVVKYTSAHVSYAESEFIVRGGHSCQGDPAAIEEVRRILLDHLDTQHP